MDIKSEVRLQIERDLLALLSVLGISNPVASPVRRGGKTIHSSPGPERPMPTTATRTMPLIDALNRRDFQSWISQVSPDLRCDYPGAPGLDAPAARAYCESYLRRSPISTSRSAADRGRRHPGSRLGSHGYPRRPASDPYRRPARHRKARQGPRRRCIGTVLLEPDRAGRSSSAWRRHPPRPRRRGKLPLPAPFDRGVGDCPPRLLDRGQVHLEDPALEFPPATRSDG